MANSSPNILVVEDDRETRTLIAKYLRNNACNVTAVSDGREMSRAMADHRVDLIILDVMLPGEDGLSLCRKVRSEAQTPIIMLTARGEDVDRIVGLEMGADDYLPKPFDPRELIAKIKVVLRRTRSVPSARPADSLEFVSFAGWRLDTRMKQMLSPDGVIVSLGGSDYRTLRALLDHPNRPLSREFLLDQVFGKERTPLDRSIDVCVSRLRHYLKDKARGAKLIRTVRNEGYMLVADVAYEA
jgi:two-component system OmpR family response regulator